MFARGLYAILDPEVRGAYALLDLAQEVLAGGCSVLQLRAKSLSDRDCIDLALSLRALCSTHRVPFVLNDRVDLARVVRADGVHLGQDDLPIEAARKLAGEMWIGLSTHSLAQALAAEKAGADMIGFGPVFPTTSKVNPDPVVGLARLREVTAAVQIPVAAIGGVTTENANDVTRAGAMFGAVISALSLATSPRDAARRLHAAMTETP